MEAGRKHMISHQQAWTEILVGALSGFLAVSIVSFVITVPSVDLFRIAATIIGGMFGFVVSKTK